MAAHVITLPDQQGDIVVYGIGDHADWPDESIIVFHPTVPIMSNKVTFSYTIQDVAPPRVVNNQVLLDEPNPTHVPRQDSARIDILLV